jgi:hypothetical protein
MDAPKEVLEQSLSPAVDKPGMEIRKPKEKHVYKVLMEGRGFIYSWAIDDRRQLAEIIIRMNELMGIDEAIQIHEEDKAAKADSDEPPPF